MNPIFFGTSARQLFGAYEPPGVGVPARGEGIVLCPPLGGEYLLSHPTYRLLARQLAATGYDVLRFDYYGTGDSAGEFEETDQQQWLSDIETAITELKDVAQVSRIALIGLRYGGTLAAQTARQRSDVDRLVMWDVVSNGAAHLAELVVSASGPDDVADVSGVAMAARARKEIAEVTLESFGAPLPKTLVAVTTPLATEHVALCARLQSVGVECELQHVPDVPAWREGEGGRIGAEGMPVTMLRRIVAWLA